jgi:hypothetical protein
MAQAVCEECGKKLVPGLTRCGACGPRPTPARLLLPSLLSLGLGVPCAVLGAIFVAGGLQAGYVVGLLICLMCLGLTATIGGAVDLVRALLALARGQELCRPLGLRWVLQAFEDRRR